jgi:diguanylate cyclase (GGDEF)-like protein
MAGIILMVRAEQPKAPAVVRIQAAMIGAAVGALGVVLVFIPILAKASGSATAVSTELAYPLGDLFLAGMVIAAWRLRGWRLDVRWGLLSGGFLLLAVSDSLYGLAVARGFPIVGELVNVLYLAAFALIAWAAWAPSHAAPTGSASAGERAIDDELAELRERAYRDRLTGLPNGLALEEELSAHEDTMPFSVLALDFDGMREANMLFKSYRTGGDVLIEAVGRALGNLVTENEFAARQHTAGDEFAVLIPGADGEAAARRADEIEASLDMLDVPPAYQRVYRGASIGHAARRPGETPGQVLGRAVAAMHARKAVRRPRRLHPY